MNKFDISILMPGIRPQNWERAYDSARKATKKSFELIIVSPYSLPESLQNKRNVKYIKDFGSPMRCYQIGSLLCEGRIIFPTMADDAVFIEDSIDKNLELLDSMGLNIKNCVVSKYSESENFSHPDRFQDDSYYKLVNAYPVNQEITNKNWWIFNAVFMHHQYFSKLGGFDCNFQAACMGFADLAVRAQLDNALVTMSDFPILRCDHILSGGDHTPIEISQVHFDTPYFKQKHAVNFSLIVDRDNWRNAENIWSHRFK